MSNSNIKEFAFETIDNNKSQLAKVSDKIFYFAELGMQEFKTSKLCTDALEQIGYTVEYGISGIPTAFMATYGSGKPVIALHFEFDAVPTGSQKPYSLNHDPIVKGAPGHAEGHNTNATVIMGTALAVKRAIEKFSLEGTVKVFSAPAEEQLVSRPYFVRDGYFKDVDAAFHAHVGSDLSTTFGLRQYGMISVEYEFIGKAAHAGQSPWLGADAVDGVKLLDIGWDVLREHLEPTQRSHRVIVSGGDQPNVTPDYAKIWYFLRESNYEKCKKLLVKIRSVAEGAALMSQTKVNENVLAAVWPTRDNKTMSELVQKNIELVGLPNWTREEEDLARNLQKSLGKEEVGLEKVLKPLIEATQDTSSNDSGDITWIVPHGRITFPANVEGIPFHNWAAGVVPASTIAHKAIVSGAKVLSGSIIDIFTDPNILEEAKNTFEEEIDDIEYTPLLDPEQKPPIYLNKESMEKFRPDMEEFYINDPVNFN